jgi:hypothetical protein
MNNMRPFESVFEAIPEYKHYPSVDELHEHSYDLQKRYHDMVTVETIGASQQGRPLILEKINDRNDPKQPKALYVGSVHANEVVGGLTVQHTEEELCARPELLQELGDCALWAIKTADPDGYEDQRWLSSEFTPRSYMAGLMRQAGPEQVAWGFQNLHKGRNAVTPEVRALADVLDEYKPDFYYPLHNASFGTGYFYATKNYPDLFEQLHNGLLQIGLCGKEPPESSRPLWSESVYGYETLPVDSSAKISCIHYAASQNPNCMSLVTEVPYVTSGAADSYESSGMTVGEARSFYRELQQEDVSILAPIVNRYAREESTIRTRAAQFVYDYMKQPRNWVAADRYAGTPLSRADRMHIELNTLYRPAYIGQVGITAAERGDTRSQQTIHQLIEEHVARAETVGKLEVVPIRDLVTLQARVGLLAMQHHFRELAKNS